MVTDHKPLVYLQTQPKLSRREVRWSEYLKMFRFKWQYRPGRINVADPFSSIQSSHIAALTRSKTAKPAVPVSSSAENPSSVLHESPSPAVQKPVSLFKQQVLEGYKQDLQWFDKLKPVEQSKCHQEQGFGYHNQALSYLTARTSGNFACKTCTTAHTVVI